MTAWRRVRVMMMTTRWRRACSRCGLRTRRLSSAPWTRARRHLLMPLVPSADFVLCECALLGAHRGTVKNQLKSKGLLVPKKVAEQRATLVAVLDQERNMLMLARNKVGDLFAHTQTSSFLNLRTPKRSKPIAHTQSEHFDLRIPNCLSCIPNCLARIPKANTSSENPAGK